MKRSDSILLNLYKGKLPKYQQRGLFQPYTNVGDFNTSMGIPSRSQIEKQYEARKTYEEWVRLQQEKLRQEEARRRQTFVGPADTRVSTQIIKKELADQRARQEAQQRSPLAQTFGSFTPTGSPAAGAIGAEMFVNMNPITAPAMSAGRLTQQALGQNPYGFDANNPWYKDALSGLGVIGDIFSVGMVPTMKVSQNAPLSSQMSTRLTQQIRPPVQRAITPAASTIGKNLYEMVDPETGKSTFQESPITQRYASSSEPIFGRDEQGVFSEINGIRSYELLPPADEIVLGKPVRTSLLNITEADYNSIVNRLNAAKGPLTVGSDRNLEIWRMLREAGYDVGGMSSSQQLRDMSSVLSQNLTSGTNFNTALQNMIRSYITPRPTGSWGSMPTSYLSNLTYDPNAWINRGSFLGNLAQKIKRQANVIDYELGDFYRNITSKTPPAYNQQSLVDEINQELAKGVGVKKTNLPLRIELNPGNQNMNEFYLRTFVDDKLAGDINLVRNMGYYTGGPRQKLSEILFGNRDLNTPFSKWSRTQGFVKRGDYPLSYYKGADLKQQGISGEFNKAINEVLKRKGFGNILSGGTGHSTLGEQRWENLVQKGLAEYFGDQYYKLKKQGGPVVNPRGYMDGQPPKGSNWRIPGNGMGTSITMDLPNMPDEILVVPDGDFDKAKVMKRGEEEYFAGADFVDEYTMGPGGTTGPKIAVRDYPTMKGGGLTAKKAREILHDKEVHGHPLTEKQRKFFGAIAGGAKAYQLGGLTDDQKRELARRVVTIAKQRKADRKWVDVPESIKNSPAGQEEGTNACIGGVCSVLEEAGAMPNIIWSNTEFSKQAPQLGFPNRGWGLKGIENLEPGDVVQWMETNYKNRKKAIPHHAQIFIGENEDGYYQFWDNYNKMIRSYPKEEIEDQLDWGKKPDEDQMQIYKINPYNPPEGRTINPKAQKALEDRKRNVRYQTNNETLPEYEYSLREDSPLRNNPPIGVEKFLEKANDYKWIGDVVRKVDKAGYANRATREQVHDSLLNVFGLLGQENKWQNPWVGGNIAPSWMPQIPLESTIERAASPSSMSIGPGQIKYSELSKPLRKAFGIKRRQDLQNWDKVIPLMVGMDIANKQWMENQGERFSERIIGDPGLTSQQMKWDEGRLSPYFYRGPGVRDVRDYVRSLADDTWYDALLPKFERTRREMEMDPKEKDQYVKENIRKYQKVFDPGSYGRNVWENWANNLERRMLNPSTDNGSNILYLPEVILPSKPRPRRQLGGNALAMLRDYGTGISVPRLNSPVPKAQKGKTIYVSNLKDPALIRYNDSLTLYNNYIKTKAGFDKALVDLDNNPKKISVTKVSAQPLSNPYQLPDEASTIFMTNTEPKKIAPQYKTRVDYTDDNKGIVKRIQTGNVTFPAFDIMHSTLISPVNILQYNPDYSHHVKNPNYTGDVEEVRKATLDDFYYYYKNPKHRAVMLKEWPYLLEHSKRNIGQFLPEYVKPVQPVVYKPDFSYQLPQPKQPTTLKSFEYNPDTPTKYSFTYPTGKYNEQKTIYFPTKSALKAFTQGVRGATYEEGDNWASATGNYKDGGGYGVFGYVGDGWYKNGGQHGGLDRWFAEKWVDIKSGKPCGRQEGESRAYPACRPSRRVSSKTPKTSGEMSSSEKAKFKSSKTSSQRIPYNHKRR